MAGLLRSIYMRSIGALFQAYPVAIPAGTKILVVPRSSAAIVTLLFKKRRKFSTESLLWFH